MIYFLKNLSKFSVGVWLSALISLIFVPIIASYLTPVEYGKGTMFLLEYNLFLNFFLLGMDQAYLRFYNEFTDKEDLLKQVYYFPILLFVLLSPILIFGNNLFSVFFIGEQNLLFSVLLILCVLIGICQRYAFLMIRMDGKGLQYSLVQIIQAILNSIITLLYAYFINPDFFAFIYAFLISNLVAWIVAVLLRRKIWFNVFKRFDLKFIKKDVLAPYLSYSWPFISTFLMAWLMEGLGKILLRVFSDFNELGLYSIAMRIASILYIVQSGFTLYWTSYSMERYARNPEDKSFYLKIFDALFITFVLIICGMLFCKDIFKLILPSTYYDALNIYPILLYIPMFYTLSEITVVGINFMKKTKLHNIVLLAPITVNILVGIPAAIYWGAKGVTLAVALAYIAFGLMRTFFSMKLYKIDFDFKRFTIVNLVLFAIVLLNVFWGNVLYIQYLAIVPIVTVLIVYYQTIVPFVKDVKQILVKVKA